MFPISDSTSLSGLKPQRAGGFFKWLFLIKCDQNARFFLNSNLIKRKKERQNVSTLLIFYSWCGAVGLKLCSSTEGLGRPFSGWFHGSGEFGITNLPGISLCSSCVEYWVKKQGGIYAHWHKRNTGKLHSTQKEALDSTGSLYVLTLV